MIHHGLRDEGQDQFQDQSHDHGNEQLPHEFFIGPKVGEEEKQAASCWIPFLASMGGCFMEGRRGLEEEKKTRRVSVAGDTSVNSLEEFRMVVAHQTHRGIRHVDGAFCDLMDDDKMLLIPMRDTGQRGFLDQSLKGKFHRHASQAQFFCRFRNSQQGNSRFSNQTQFPQPRLIELASVV